MIPTSPAGTTVDDLACGGGAGGVHLARALLAWTFGRFTEPHRGRRQWLVVTQMIETLTDSHGPLVVATNVGTLAVMALIISAPGRQSDVRLHPVGPIGWGQAFAATRYRRGRVQTDPRSSSTLIGKFHELESNPTVHSHQVIAAVMSAGSRNDDLTAWVRRLPVDAEHADAHEHGVQMLDRGCQQPGAGLDQCRAR